MIISFTEFIQFIIDSADLNFIKKIISKYFLSTWDYCDGKNALIREDSVIGSECQLVFIEPSAHLWPVKRTQGSFMIILVDGHGVQSSHLIFKAFQRI